MGVVLLGLALGLSACSDPGTGGTPSGTTGTGSRSAGGNGTATGLKALDSNARVIRAQVDALAQAFQSTSGVQRQVSVDDAGPCQVGIRDPWPQRWGYAVTFSLESRDIVNTATSLRQRLQSQGWEIRPHGTTSDAVDFDARKNGLVLWVNGEPGTTLTIEGYSACINVDGQLQPV